jgi:hypothetical protein
VNNRRNWEQGRREEMRMREVEEEEYHNKHAGYEKTKWKINMAEKNNKT